MKGYPKGRWVMPDEKRSQAFYPGKYSLFQKFLLWRTRVTAETDTNLNVFKLFVQLGSIFPVYLLFLRQILLKGRIPRNDKERIILRTAWRTGCPYEWAHHIHEGSKLGLTSNEMNRIACEEDPDWSPKVKVLMHAVDELIETHTLSSIVQKNLTGYLTEGQCVEFCMLVGHYMMVALTNNAMGVQVESGFEPEI